MADQPQSADLGFETPVVIDGATVYICGTCEGDVIGATFANGETRYAAHHNEGCPKITPAYLGLWD